MPMLKFTLRGGDPIWINTDKIVAIERELTPRPRDVGLGADIHIDGDKHWSVQESAEDVIGKIVQAKER
jgi:uncharacterized protein YlzI (FlbEa/FlbD family)